MSSVTPSGEKRDTPPAETPRGDASLLVLGVVLAILGLVIITAATFQFDVVKDHVFRAHPDAAPYVAAIGYICTIGGFLLALVHFIREG